MAFWDKIGDAYNWVKDSAIPTVGGAFTAAQHWATTPMGDDNPVSNVLSPLRDLERQKLVPVTNAITSPGLNVVGQAGEAVNTAFSYGVARPISTFAQATGDAAQEGGFSGLRLLWNGDEWRAAWNSSQDVSPGQALVIQSGLAPDGVTHDMTPEAVKAREKFFHNSWQGQVTSGALDLALNLGADPTMLAGKAIKTTAVARNTFKDAAEADKILKINAGEVKPTTIREAGLSGRMDKLFSQLDGKSSAEIMLHPVVKESDQAGVFASMFGAINEQVADEAARRAAQRNVYGAMLGNKASIDALKEQHALLANDLRRLSDTPIATKAVDAPDAVAAANSSVPVEISEQADLIEQEIARLEAATSATGTVNRLAGSLKEQYRYSEQVNGLRQSTLNTGLGNMPIRVIAGATSNRLPGHVSAKNPVDGFSDLENTLRQAPWITGTERRQLLDNYVNAATDGDRQTAILKAEGAIVRSTAAKYGVDAKKARQLLNAGREEHRAIASQLSSRLYSAADDDKFIHIVDPDNGEIVAYSRPILQSQIEDNVSIIDPRRLDAALKGATQNRTLERVLGRLGDDPKALATAAYERAGSAQMLAVDGLTKFTRLWKDAALMRLAYPARVQIDSQMRLMTHMGTMAYLGGALGAAKAEGKHLLSAQGSDKLSLRNLFKEGDYEKSLTGILKDAGVYEDDIPTIVRKLADTDGGVADLAGEMSNTMLARARATGEWGYVEGTNAAWAPAYVRAVNRQIRNSPVAMKAAEGATTDELKAFVQSNPAARREWLNLKASHADDLDQWLGSIQAHVDHYLPTAEMKAAVLDGGITGKNVDEWFGDVAKRMRVHGESYAPTAKSPIAEWYEAKRGSWYKLAAEAPEATMARTPLYAYAFKRNLKDIVARHGGEDAIDAEALMAMRRSADRLARREVGKILFDTSHASNLSRSMRFASPFFSAWEDMMKKWSGLFYDKPWAGVRFEQAWDAPNDAGIVVDENGNRVDAEGNRYESSTGRKLDPKKDAVLIGKRELVTLPAGVLKGITGADKMKIDKNSFNIVFQGDPWWLPGAGPLVQVPVNEVVKKSFPEAATNPIIAAVLPMGVSDNTVAEQLMPSWVRQAKNAFVQDSQDFANVQAMLLAQETARYNNGERGPIKAGEISDMARNWFILRAVTANASPVSMSPTPKAQFYIDQAHIYRQKYGQDWQEKFYQDFPQWYEMSLSLSNNETGIVASLNAVDAAKKYRKEIADNPQYGWMFVGPDNQYGQTPGTAFNQAAYAWEQQSIGYGQSKSFRGKSSPQEALAKAQASKGWIQYQSIMTKLNLVLEDRGLHSFQQKGAEDLADLKKQAEEILGSQNDAWRQDFLSTDSGKVVNMLDAAKTAMSNNAELAKRPDMVAIGRYMQMRTAIQGILAGRPKHSLDDPGNADVKALWDQGTSLLRSGNIGFEQAWNRVLQHDDPSRQLMGMSANGN